jgi:hypothetical protein
LSQTFINKLNNLIGNNNKVIDAIESGKSVDINKSIKACMKSNNITAEILIEYFYNNMPINKSTKQEDNVVNDLRKFFGMNK